MPLVHFLIVFDRATQRVLEAERYTDGAEAADRYAKMEKDYGHRSDVEIVLVGSDSIETVRRTHGNYFVGDEGVPFRELVG
jgi:hypothetical protein